MLKRRFQLVALLCCFLIGLSACSKKWVVLGAAAAAVGTGAYFYVKGDLNRNYEASMDKTWQASVKAVEELKLSIESKQNDAFGGVIKGKMADGKSFAINLKRLGENMTEVGIRIGTFGDRVKSEAIHDKILSKL
jgi:tRNA(Ser,Leu) C12 N-acetylase TAN1